MNRLIAISLIRAENQQTRGLLGGAEWIRSSCIALQQPEEDRRDEFRRLRDAYFSPRSTANDLRIITSELSAAELSSATTACTVRFASTGFIPRFTSAEIASSSELAGIPLPGGAGRFGPLI
jgi:hypothetical protein